MVISLFQGYYNCIQVFNKITFQVVYGYRKSRWRTILTYMLSILTAGIPFLVFHWIPSWLLYATSKRCCFQVADQVLVLVSINLTLLNTIGDNYSVVTELTKMTDFDG